MKLADVVIIADLDRTAGIIERVTEHADMTVYSVRTLSGMLYAREAGELFEAPADVAEGFARDLRILAPQHADLLPAVAVLDDAARPPVESPLEVMQRIGHETGQPVTAVEPAPAAERAPRTRRRNRLVVNGEQIA